MNKRTFVIAIGSVIAVTLISGVVVLAVSKEANASGKGQPTINTGSITDIPENDGDDFTYVPPILEDPIDSELEPEFDEEIENFVPATEMDLDPSSITVYVNKEYALPKNYKPENMVTPNIKFNLIYYDERTLMRPEASEALEKLFAAAQKAGYELYGVSGYRSYARQKNIFLSNIVSKGKTHTLKYSAVPGTSEHQTGLAIDVSTKALRYNLTDKFADSPEGLWLAENAYRYGYIIRYPLGKAEITGYAYEPWHIRYVGKGLANYLYENDLTLDEYYKYTPSPDFDFETLYADLINYVPPVVTTTPGADDGLIVGDNGEIIEGGLGEEIDPGDGEVIEDPDVEDPEDPDAENPDDGEEEPPVDGENPDDGQGTPGNGEDGTDPENPGGVDLDGDGIVDVTITPTPTPPLLSTTPTPPVIN